MRNLKAFCWSMGFRSNVPSAGSISKTIPEAQGICRAEPHLPPVRTDYGEKALAAILVDEAIRLDGANGDAERWGKLERYLNLDGFALLKDMRNGMLKEEVMITGGSPWRGLNFVAAPQKAPARSRSYCSEKGST